MVPFTDTRPAPGAPGRPASCLMVPEPTGIIPAKTSWKTVYFVNSETNPSIQIFSDPQELARAVTAEWVSAARSREDPDHPFCVALSGGKTPRLLFNELSRPSVIRNIPWKRVHIFWGDERCVPPDHPESNFKMAWDGLLKFAPIPQEQIHRIRGEADPYEESKRYAAELRQVLKLKEGLPCFDWILLGLGADGHTASLFPGQEGETEPFGMCTVLQHPETGQNRISLTLNMINQSYRTIFLVTGLDKAETVSEIMNNPEKCIHFPAAQVQGKRVEWFLDQQASSKLGK